MLQLLVGIRFQVCFTPLIGVLFTFPSRYLFAIGRSGVLSLGGWSPHVQTGFHVSRLTRRHCCFLPIQDYHLLWCDFPDTSSSYNNAIGLVRFRSPLLSESRLISFPPGTEMFHFPGFALSRLCIQRIIPIYDQLFVISPNSEKSELKTENQSKGGFPHSDIHGSKPVDSSP